ncbi:MAG: alpha/beta hydrolase [Nannocystales bacterium]
MPSSTRAEDHKRVARDKLADELQPYFRRARLVSAAFARPWCIRLIHGAARLLVGRSIAGLDCGQAFIPSRHGGPPIRVRTFRPRDTDGDLPAVLYLHGGGYAFGTPEIALDKISAYIATRPCVVIAPDYRKSLLAPYPAAFHDCYDTLLWIRDNASDLGARSSRIVVAGHSAGGGLTAAVTHAASETGDADIAFQMPFYPMLDDRQDSASAREMQGAPGWSRESSATCWALYLRGIDGPAPLHAAPARRTDVSGSPPVVTYVGELDPFRDETLAYVAASRRAGIPVMFTQFRGAFHGFETFAASSPLGQQAHHFECDAFGKFVDRYASACEPVR